jgi:hypothetical protein
MVTPIGTVEPLALRALDPALDRGRAHVKPTCNSPQGRSATHGPQHGLTPPGLRIRPRSAPSGGPDG